MDRLWLQKKFKTHPTKSKAELARHLSLEPSAISKILAGGRQIKAAEYVRMQQFFGDDAVVGMQGHAYEQSDVNDKYVLGQLSSAGLSEDTESQVPSEDSWVMPASLLSPKTKAAPEDIKIFTVQETAMMPDFNKGENVLVDISDKKPSPAGVFVISDGMANVIRQCSYIPHSDPAVIKVSAIDTKYEDYEIMLSEAQLIGRVIAKLQWL